MKKLLKIVVICLAITGIVLGGVVFFLDSIVERFRPQIQTAVSEAVGRPVTFGEIESRIFPSVAITLADVQVSGAAGARISSLALKTSLGDLLSGDISVSQLGLSGVELSVLREADGSLQIAGIPLSSPQPAAGKTPAAQAPGAGAGGAASPEEVPTAEPRPGRSSGAAPASAGEPQAAADAGSFSLKVKNAELADVNVIFTDNTAEPPQKIELRGLRASLKDIDTAGRANIDLTATLLGTRAENVRIYGELGNPLAAFPLNATLELNDLDLARVSELASAYGADLAGIKLSNSLSLTLSARSNASGLALSSLLDAKPAGLVFKDIFNKPSGVALGVDALLQATLAGTATAEKFTLTLGESAVHAPFEYSPGAPLVLSLKTTALNLSQLSSYLPPVQRFSPAGELSADLSLKLPQEKGGAPSAEGSLSLSNVSAMVPMAAEEGEAAEAKLLPIEALNGEISFTGGEKIKANNLTLKIAGQPVSLQVGAASYSQPKLAFELKSDKLDLGALGAILAPQAAALQQSFINALKLSGTYSTGANSGSVTLNTAAARLAEVPIESASLRASLTNDLITLAPSSIGAFGGRLNVGGNLTLGQQQLLTVALSGEGMQAGQVSDTFLASSPVGLTGAVSELKSNIRTNLASPLPTANGSARLMLLDGAITGVNIIGQTLRGIDSIPGLNAGLSSFVPEEYSDVLQGSDTAFSDFTMDSIVRNNQLELRGVKLTHPLYLITGTGNVGFDGAMDIKAQLRLTPTLADKMVLKEPKLKLLHDRNRNLVVPIEIVKKQGRVLVIPDTSDLAKRAATNTAKEAAGRALDRLAPGAGGIVDSLFK